MAGKKSDYVTLKQDAKRNRHSVHREVLDQIAEKAEVIRHRKQAARAMRELNRAREEFAKRYGTLSDSVELIREDRDSR